MHSGANCSAPQNRRGAVSNLAVRVLAMMAAVTLPTSAGFAQVGPEQALKALNVADGFEVKLFASEPMVVNPIAVDVDSLGRVWVTEGVNYRKNVTDPPNNKIKVLEDTDGDGVADKVTVFTSDLNAAMGVCVAGQKIYVPESPNLYVYEDQNGDLQPDGPRKVLLTGFGGKNHDHGSHSHVFGPDHKLYMTQGDSGYDVTGPDGKRVSFKWGAMLRAEGDGTQLEELAVNFRNPFELSVDSFGNVWCSDNDNDGPKSVRICWILEGGNYGWFGGPEMIRNPDGSFDPIHHWRADKPGFVPYVLITGFGSPCGMTFYEGPAFGAKYQNTILHCDAGPREVRDYAPQRLKGVGFTATAENVVTSSDNYFRPVDVCVAPDGAVFLTDWYDGGVGGHAYNDPNRGHIYRLVPKGKTLTRVGKPGPYTNDDDALVALGSPNNATTFLARERLLASGSAAIPALTRLTQGTDRTLHARALWLLDRIGGSGHDVIRRDLVSADPAFRALAVRILRRQGAAAESDLLSLTSDPDGEVLKEVLLGLGKLPSPAATAAIIKAFGRYDGTDRYLLESLGIAARGRETEIFNAVVEQPGAVVDQRLINLVRIFKPEDATQYLSTRLSDAKLPLNVRQSLATALASMASPEAGKSLAALLAGTAPVELKRLALESLRKNLNLSWSSIKSDPQVAAGVKQALADPELTADALVVVADAGLKDFGPAVSALLADERTSAPVKLAAIDAAAKLGARTAQAPLTKLVRASDGAVRDAALRALVTLGETKVLGEMLADKATPAPVKMQIVDQLAGTSDGGVFLLRLIDTKKLDATLAARAIAAAVEHPDVNVRLLYQKFVPESERPKTLGQAFTADEILKLAGDASRGESVFLRSGAASCNKCHKVKGRGADIGPDLSQIGRKYERRALLETIMQPSAGIAPEYVPYVVETNAGKVYAGFLHAQNDLEVVLKAIDGSTVRIPRKNVEEIVKQSVSLMPELVLKNVTAQDAADLLAYLVSLQATEVQAMTFKAIGPFPNRGVADRSTVFGPEKSPGEIDVRARHEGVGRKPVSWTDTRTLIGPLGAAVVDLLQLGVSLGAPTEHVIFYFAVNLESASAQPAILSIGSDDGVQVWLNGAKIHDAKQTRPLKPGEDKVPVQLNSGKNLILLKLDQGSGPGGLSLSAAARNNIVFTVP